MLTVGVDIALEGFPNLAPPLHDIPVAPSHGREAIRKQFNVFGITQQGLD